MRRISTVCVLAMASALALACGSGGSTGPAPIDLTGVVHDYFTNAALDSVDLAVDGSALTATGSATGHYSFPDLASHTTLTIVAQRNLYRDTRNEAIAVGTSSLSVPLYLVAASSISGQYTLVGKTQTAGTATVIVDLVDAAGQPRPGLAASDIALSNGGGAVGEGPYLFGSGGNLDQNLTVTTTFGGRTRVAFLNVPAGNLTLGVTIAGTGQLTTSLATSADGVTLVAR